MEMWLRCKVGGGQFSGEFAVTGEDFRGEQFSLFAPEEFVELDGDPSFGEVNGLIRVSIMAEERDLVLVGLPRPALINSQSVTVRKSALSRRPARQEA
jgi:hypothetical protein